MKTIICILSLVAINAFACGLKEERIPGSSCAASEKGFWAAIVDDSGARKPGCLVCRQVNRTDFAWQPNIICPAVSCSGEEE